LNKCKADEKECKGIEDSKGSSTSVTKKETDFLYNFISSDDVLGAADIRKKTFDLLVKIRKKLLDMLTKGPNKNIDQYYGYPTESDQTRHEKDTSRDERERGSNFDIENSIKNLIYHIVVQTNIYDRFNEYNKEQFRDCIKKYESGHKKILEEHGELEKIFSYFDNPALYSIENSLTFLENSNEQISIADFANKVGLNLKTFQRHFQKHMGCSPVEYRRICRFRNSLTNKLNNTLLKNLTEISYEEGYYDQSYLIKEFRKITNHNPKDFFKSASKVDGDKIIWEIK
jgi:AraC-like DNA-binding protein